MNRIVLGIGMVAAIAHASPAVAQTCGGSNDGGSSSSGGGGDSSSSGDGGGSSDVEVCHDDTDITGLEQCTRFGAGWDASSSPRLILRTALGVRRVSFDGLELDGTSTHDANPYRWGIGEDDLAATGVTAFAFELGMSFFLFENVFTGVHLGMGGGPFAGPSIDTGDLVLDPRAAVFFEGATGIGVSLPLGDVAIRVEARTGLRGVNLSFDSTHGACVTTTSTWVASWFVEPRVSLDWFVSPWITLGAFAGADVLDDLAMHGGLSFALHARSFDGQ